MMENKRTIFENRSNNSAVKVDNIMRVHSRSLEKNQEVYSLIGFSDSLVHMIIPHKSTRQSHT